MKSLHSVKSVVLLMLLASAAAVSGQDGAVDKALLQGSRRAALNQWWTTNPQYGKGLGVTHLGPTPRSVQSDGVDLWVPSIFGFIFRVRASDGKLLETWTGASVPGPVLVAMGRVFTVLQDIGEPGVLYMIDPSQPVGAVATVASGLGSTVTAIAFDGARIWTANQGSVSIVTPQATPPWSVTTVPVSGNPSGILYDGENIWVTNVLGTLQKLDGNGNVLRTVRVGTFPRSPVFDGIRIWVPNSGDDTVSVVKASNGSVVKTLHGNGLHSPNGAAFDGQRILVTDFDAVSLWDAADFEPLGTFSTGSATGAGAVCSDGLNFWIVLPGAESLARF